MVNNELMTIYVQEKRKIAYGVRSEFVEYTSKNRMKEKKSQAKQKGKI